MADKTDSNILTLMARGCAGLLLLWCASAMATTTQPPDDAPGQVVRALHERLLEVMRQGPALGYSGRYEALAPCIKQSFDFPLMANIVLGRQRTALGAAEKDSFTDLLTRLSIATYASRFDDYAGEEFVEIARKSTRRGRVLVQTELRRAAAEPVSLDYLLHEQAGSWRIISVIANGVNDLSLKRAEYAAVIKKQGYAGLLEEIASKIVAMGDDD